MHYILTLLSAFILTTIICHAEDYWQVSAGLNKASIQPGKQGTFGKYYVGAAWQPTIEFSRKIISKDRFELFTGLRFSMSSYSFVGSYQLTNDNEFHTFFNVDNLRLEVPIQLKISVYTFERGNFGIFSTIGLTPGVTFTKNVSISQVYKYPENGKHLGFGKGWDRNLSKVPVFTFGTEFGIGLEKPISQKLSLNFAANYHYSFTHLNPIIYKAKDVSYQDVNGGLFFGMNYDYEFYPVYNVFFLTAGVSF